MQFDKTKAEAVLAGLSLSVQTRRFADVWLAEMAEDGSFPNGQVYDGLDDDMKSNIVAFEITPQSIRIVGAGRIIVEAVGSALVGEDYLQMAPVAQRATRLARMCAIVEGHISTHQRWVVNTAGKLHVVNELALPCGLSAKGLPMITTYVDVDAKAHVGKVPMNKGAMHIAPVFESYPIHRHAA